MWLALLLFIMSCAGSHGAHCSEEAKTKPSPDSTVLTDVLVFHQDSGALGKTALFLGKDGGRFEIHNGNIIASCCAPKWDIFYYSKSKKMAYVKSTVNLRGDRLQFFDTPIELSVGKVSRKKNPTLHLDYREFFVDGSKIANPVSDPVFFQQRSRRVVRDVIYEVADIGQIKPELQNFIWFVFGHRNLPGVPLDLKISFTNSKIDNSLSTLSVEKVRKANSFFAPPKDFGRTNDKKEISYSDDYKSTIDDLFSTSAPLKIVRDLQLTVGLISRSRCSSIRLGCPCCSAIAGMCQYLERKI